MVSDEVLRLVEASEAWCVIGSFVIKVASLEIN